MTRERISIDDPGKPGWRAGPVARVSGVRRRWRGIHGVPPGWGVLLRSRSIHTFGMRAPLGVVTLDERLEKIEAITRDDIKELARRVLRGPRVVGAVGPFANGDFERYVP